MIKFYSHPKCSHACGLGLKYSCYLPPLPPGTRPHLGSRRPPGSGRFRELLYEFIGFRAMDVTKPYEFIGFGAMDVTKPYEFIGFGAIDVLWEVVLNLLRVGNRSFWGSGRLRGHRRPLQKVGGKAPHLLEGSPGPPGPPRPPKWPISDPSHFFNSLPSYSHVNPLAKG